MALIGALTFHINSPSVVAQVEASLDLGVGSITYKEGSSLGEDPTFSVVTLSPQLQYSNNTIGFAVAGSFARLRGEGWGSRMLAGVSALSSGRGPFHGEVRGAAEFNTNQASSEGGAVSGGGRLHAAGKQLGAWVGFGLSRTFNGTDWQSTPLAELGIWEATGPLEIRVRALATSYLPAFQVDPERRSMIYATASATFLISELEVLGGVEVRRGELLETSVGWSLAGSYQLTSLLSVVGSAREYTPDPIQALPGGNYLSMGLSLRWPAEVTPSGYTREQRRALALVEQPRATLSVNASGDLVLTISDLSAERVEIAGSFNDWEPRRMTRVGQASWSITLRLEPGRYTFNLRADGGSWFAPSGVPSVPDEFSGRVAVLLVSNQ